MGTDILELEVRRIGLDVNHVLFHTARVARASAVRAPNGVDVGKRRVHLGILIHRNTGGCATGTASTAKVGLKDERLLLGLGVQLLTKSAVPAHIAHHGSITRVEEEIITALWTETHRTDLLQEGHV